MITSIQEIPLPDKGDNIRRIELRAYQDTIARLEIKKKAVKAEVADELIKAQRAHQQEYERRCDLIMKRTTARVEAIKTVSKQEIEKILDETENAKKELSSSIHRSYAEKYASLVGRLKELTDRNVEDILGDLSIEFPQTSTISIKRRSPKNAPVEMETPDELDERLNYLVLKAQQIEV